MENNKIQKLQLGSVMDLLRSAKGKLNRMLGVMESQAPSMWFVLRKFQWMFHNLNKGELILI